MNLLWLVPVLSGAAMTELGYGYWGYTESASALVALLAVILQATEIAQQQAQIAELQAGQ